MGLSEKVAYLRGLSEGLGIDAETKEGKVLLAIVDVLEEMSDTITEIEEAYGELDELVDIIDEDLGQVEEDLYGDIDEDDELYEDDVYEITCPSCGNTVYLDEEMLLDEGIDCPECGQELEFDLDCLCDDHDCACKHTED